MSSVSAWIVYGPSVTNAFYARRAAEEADPPEDYSGPMDDRTYAMMSSMVNLETWQPQYETKTVNGNNPFTLFTYNSPSEQQLADDVEFLDGKWPGQQFQMNGAWYFDTGLQVGLSYVVDEDGNQTGDTEGVPVYPIPDDAYTLMPPIPVYDDDGNLIEEIPPTSNTDLRDIYLSPSIRPRIFVDAQAKVLTSTGAEFSPAELEITGTWEAGLRVEIEIQITSSESGDVSVLPITWTALTRGTSMQATLAILEALDASPLFHAGNIGNRIFLEPEASIYTLEVSAFVYVT